MPRGKKPKVAAVTAAEIVESQNDSPTVKVKGAEKLKRSRAKKVDEMEAVAALTNGVESKGRGSKKAKIAVTVENSLKEDLIAVSVEKKRKEPKTTAKKEIMDNGDLATGVRSTKGRGKKAAETNNAPTKHENGELEMQRVEDTKLKAVRGNKKPKNGNDDVVTKEIKAGTSTTAARGRKRNEISVEPVAVVEETASQEKKAPRSRKRAANDPPKSEQVETGGTPKTRKVETAAKPKRKADNKIEKVVENEVEVKAKTVRKRGAAKPAAAVVELAKNVQSVESKPTKAKKALLNPTETNYSKADFELADVDKNISTLSNSSVERKQLKISSWNVAGLRSWLKKDGLKFLDFEEPDIFCLQEIKCTLDQMPEEAKRIPGYHPYWLCLPGGYAGVALYSKIMPINVEYGIDDADFDDAGRLITAEYEKFFLINVYVPNSGRKLVNLEARMRWEKLFQAHVNKYDSRKPVIICGDMNVSHHEIDLANPKSNTRSAGFTIEEREKMTELLSSLNLTDTFRQLYPQKTGAYTYWTYMANARSRNVGWRLDYFIVSKRIDNRVVENAIRSQVMGSDHCPITLFINI